METNVIFDTHEYIKSMTEAGVEPRAAEAIAKGQVAYLTSTAATKTDVANIQRDIASLEIKLTKQIADAQFKTIAILAGIMAAYGGFLVAILTLL